MTYVLDTSAVFRFLYDEAGAERVAELFTSVADRKCRIAISAVNWGEVIYLLANRFGPVSAERAATGLLQRGLIVVPATQQRAHRAGLIKSQYKTGYADSFGVELTQDSPEHVLVTADFGVKAVGQDVSIEFLPTKP